MYKLFTALLLLSGINLHSIAQVVPTEGSTLHYRIIGFSFPKVPKATAYTLQIAAGNDTTAGDFEKNIILSLDNKTNKVIAEVPSFGKEYTWRVKSKGSSDKSSLYHFSTITLVQADTAASRVRIISDEHKYNDAYVFIDATRCLFDIKGQPVWYLPDIKGMVDNYSQVRDIKLTPQGTITFMMNEEAFEINYQGEVLWHVPAAPKMAGLTHPHFHHEVTRLANGHYMGLGYEFAYFKLPTPDDNTLAIATKEDARRDPKHIKYRGMQFGTILEYDHDGKLLWTWKAVEHLDIQSLYYRKPPPGPDNLDLHQNAFYFNEQTKQIYVSFKNISQVLKINYPKGDVIKTYGTSYEFNVNGDGADFFCDQHSCKLGQSGYFYVFNNNNCHNDMLPTIVKMKEATKPGGQLEKVWEFECPVEDKEEMKQFDKSHFGNVTELADRNLFASVSSPFGNVFIVSPDKKVLWNAVSEKWNDAEKKWKMAPTYRASIIPNRKLLEQLIWGNKISSK